MTHTKNFEIAIPKEFLKSNIPYNEEMLDFFFKVNVNYTCDAKGDKMEIYHVSCGFTTVKFIAWDMPLLERYFLDAAHNNWESQFKPASNLHPVFEDIFNSIASATKPKVNQLEDVINISQQGEQC